MRPLRILGLILLIVLLLWISRGFFTSRVEKPKAINTKQYDGFEVRTLPSQIIATVTVSASNESDASSKGFRTLADFIFGNNTAKSSIAMTAPVTAQQTSHKIAMTAPVLSNQSTPGDYQVGFIMPSEWTLETLPVPNNEAITITQKEKQTIAVYTFGGYAIPSVVAKQKDIFQELLEQTHLTTQGSVTLAQYNDPRTPPRMRTNELWVTITD